MPCRAIARTTAEVIIGAVQEIGGKQHDRTGGNDQVHGPAIHRPSSNCHACLNPCDVRQSHPSGGCRAPPANNHSPRPNPPGKSRSLRCDPYRFQNRNCPGASALTCRHRATSGKTWCRKHRCFDQSVQQHGLQSQVHARVPTPGHRPRKPPGLYAADPPGVHRARPAQVPSVVHARSICVLRRPVHRTPACSSANRSPCIRDSKTR